MADATISRTLVPLGFTPLEAEVYALLLRRSPATGYRVAQAIAKPVANTYKAIQSLEHKGAVVVDDGDNRLCRAVPPEELFARMSRGFDRRCKNAIAACSAVHTDTSDDRIYQVRTAEQVFERARRMLKKCREVALIDAFPKPLAQLREDIQQCASRGPVVGLRVYQPETIDRVKAFLPTDAAATLARWPGQWLNVVVDGTEYVLAFLSPSAEEVCQAVWSKSAYLSWVYHCGLAAEILLAEVSQLARSQAPRDRFEQLFSEHRRLMAFDAPGYQALMARFAAAPDATAGRSTAFAKPDPADLSSGPEETKEVTRHFLKVQLRKGIRASAKSSQRKNTKQKKGVKRR
jgi:sugar-specific transcriptional regulator TrmB